MTKIFLSYARNDDEPFVRRLHDDLTTAGFTVWFDRVSMPTRNLTFHQEIRDAISDCDRLLLIVGPEAAASEYVRQEWQFAYFEADKVVAPILRRGDYPLAVEELKSLHCEDFRSDTDYHAHLRELIRILREEVPRIGELIAVPSLPVHFLSRADRLVPLRNALRADLFFRLEGPLEKLHNGLRKSRLDVPRSIANPCVRPTTVSPCKVRVASGGVRCSCSTRTCVL